MGRQEIEKISVETEKVVLEEMTIKYSQEQDCTKSGDLQTIEIKTQDGGGGKYFVIKTSRWAINDSKDLDMLIKDFQNRLNVKSKIVENEERIKL